jgi:hypothetical protein
MGTAETPAEPMSGLIFPWVSTHMSFPNRMPQAVAMQKANRPRKIIFEGIHRKEPVVNGGGAHGDAQKDGNDVRRAFWAVSGDAR